MHRIKFDTVSNTFWLKLTNLVLLIQQEYYKSESIQIKSIQIKSEKTIQ